MMRTYDQVFLTNGKDTTLQADAETTEDMVDDLLICGTCQKEFPLKEITTFMQHKKYDCDEQQLLSDRRSLQCQSCPEQFRTAWGLLKHAQKVHSLHIYQEHGVQTREQLRLTAPHRVDMRPMESSGECEKSILEERANPMWDSSPMVSKEEQPVVASNLCTEALDTPAHKPQTLDTTVQATSQPGVSTSAADKEVSDDQLCCDNQDCGITMVPVTHEQMKKCCSAVLPKKRKRHMEIKHLTSVARSRLKKYSGTMKRRAVATPTPAPSIFIDLETNRESSRKGPPLDEVTGEKSMLQRQSTVIPTSVVGTQKSVIIQPGSMLSIPVSHSATPLNNNPAIGYGLNSAKTEHANAATSILPSERVSPAQAQCSISARMPVTKELLQQDKKLQHSTATSCKATDGGKSSGKSLKKRRYPTSKPYKCDQCDNAFNQRIHLKKHQSKHTGVKPFKCEQCDYSTVERSHLKVHIRVHTGEKPFRCTYCEYATAQNSTLKIHLKRHHNRMAVYPCGTCGKEFAEEGDLNSHAREHKGTAASLPATRQGTRVSQAIVQGTAQPRWTTASSTVTAVADSPLDGTLHEVIQLAIPAGTSGPSTAGSLSHSPVPMVVTAKQVGHRPVVLAAKQGALHSVPVVIPTEQRTQSSVPVVMATEQANHSETSAKASRTMPQQVTKQMPQ